MKGYVGEERSRVSSSIFRGLPARDQNAFSDAFFSDCIFCVEIETSGYRIWI
jgi:hypothetical protein